MGESLPYITVCTNLSTRKKRLSEVVINLT